MKSKKAQIAINEAIYFVLGFLVLFILIWKGPELISKVFTQSNTQLESIKLDCDSDGVENIADKCKCIPGVDSNEGCLPNYDGPGIPLTPEQAKLCAEGDSNPCGLTKTPESEITPIPQSGTSASMTSCHVTSISFAIAHLMQPHYRMCS